MFEFVKKWLMPDSSKLRSSAKIEEVNGIPICELRHVSVEDFIKDIRSTSIVAKLVSPVVLPMDFGFINPPHVNYGIDIAALNESAKAAQSACRQPITIIIEGSKKE